MEITEVKIFLVDEEKLRAFVSIVLDKCFMINDIKVIQGRDGLFISMPSRRKKNGDFKDVAHPLNNETRSWLEKHILTEYQRLRQAQSARDRDDEVEDLAASGGARATLVADQTAAVAAAPRDLTRPDDSTDERLSDVAREHLSDSYWTVG